jgi:hypothetical protein
MNMLNKSRVIAASLDPSERLEDQAVKPGLKRKEAFDYHCARVFEDYKNSDYGVVDLSSL